MADDTSPGRGQAGQASVELVALLPLIALLAALLVQGALAGWAQWSAGSAARAAARAAAVGSSPQDAARAAVPDGLRRGVRVRPDGEGVRVTVRIPALVPGVGSVHARARFTPQGAGS
ncbi:pilus assembly protein [Conexibacter sp. W3-3-2]|uniref:TadE/TadG family type IV pilus assembly protein n=1 Tax=Conexibacter sp. W3-3-2 TaxID=2675227 RepID=UPI0012B94698|nr:TadE/TadG family type IV pilus assembly protein [Conexibacter sp. W3-3-2]MTD44006.1 pilus assembly protein [Conexibacter sp. W3-3-2]